MDYKQDSIGKIVLEARKEKGFKNQIDLARKVKVEPVYICNIEKNRHIPSVDLGAKIARILDLNVKEFLYLILRSKYPHLSQYFN